MSRVSTDYKRLFVQALKWDSEDQSIEFFAALKSAARARYSETSAGRLLIGTSGNNKSVTFAIPQGAELTPTIIAELIGELLRNYDEAKAALVAAGTATPTDAEIYAELLA